VNNHGFYLKGRRILKEGWMQYYTPYIRAKEVLLPSIKEGDSVRFKSINKEDQFTCPPPRYNQSSFLKKMEQLEIGTKATRADIIETLYNREYVKDERIKVTELGFEIIDILGRYAPDVTSARLTQELDKKMEQIQNNTMKRENVIADVIEQLKPQLEKLKQNQEAIGEALSKAIKKVTEKERLVGKCPTCKTGDLAIIYSRKTKKRFIGCTNYFKGLCSTSFPLPQRGTVKPTRSRCKLCGWPQVLVWLKSRKPWNLCFNPDCSSKAKLRKKL
jgi:DNA topoisomerase-1